MAGRASRAQVHRILKKSKACVISSQGCDNPGLEFANAFSVIRSWTLDCNVIEASHLDCPAAQVRRNHSTKIRRMVVFDPNTVSLLRVGRDIDQVYKSSVKNFSRG